MTNPEPTPGKKKRWPIVIGVIVAVFVALGVLGAIVGPQDEESDTAAEATTTTSAATTTVAQPTTTTQPTTTATSAPASTTTAAAAPARATDPRCATADEAMVGWISAGLTDTSLTLQNAVVIEDDGLLFIGASTVRPDGKFENRSDVWIVRDSLPFSSTGGARNTTEWVKASDALGIAPSDERVQAVDACVVELTRG